MPSCACRIRRVHQERQLQVIGRSASLPELIIHTEKFVYGKLFGPYVHPDSGLLHPMKNFVPPEAWKSLEQIVRELFPSRRKRLLDEGRELMRLRHVGFPVQADQGRVHFGTGLERAWRHGEAITDRCVVLDQNGE